MVVLLESELCNFPCRFLFLSLRTQRICCNGKIMSLYHNTKNVSEIFPLLISIQSIVQPRFQNRMCRMVRKIHEGTAIQAV